MLSVIQPVLTFFKTGLARSHRDTEEIEQPEPVPVTQPARSRRALRRPDNHRKRKRLNRRQRRR
jgi:hypothetical protein